MTPCVSLNMGYTNREFSLVFKEFPSMHYPKLGLLLIIFLSIPFLTLARAKNTLFEAIEQSDTKRVEALLTEKKRGELNFSYEDLLDAQKQAYAKYYALRKSLIAVIKNHILPVLGWSCFTASFMLGLSALFNFLACPYDLQLLIPSIASALMSAGFGYLAKILLTMQSQLEDARQVMDVIQSALNEAKNDILISKAS